MFDRIDTYLDHLEMLIDRLINNAYGALFMILVVLTGLILTRGG